jgi:hypothetical protein
MRMAKSSMAMMMRAGTRKVRMYSWWGISKGNSVSSVGSEQVKQKTSYLFSSVANLQWFQSRSGSIILDHCGYRILLTICCKL